MTNVAVTEEKDEYIGQFLRVDVLAFCNAVDEDGNNLRAGMRIARKVEKAIKKYPTFSLSAFLFHSLWFAYRGMIGQAVLVDVFKLIFVLAGVILPSKSMVAWIVYLISYLIYGLVLGLYAVPWYGKYMSRCLKKRNLEQRKKISCDTLQDSLRRQGKVSVGRAVCYSVLHGMAFFVVKSLFLLLRMYF